MLAVAAAVPVAAGSVGGVALVEEPADATPSLSRSRVVAVSFEFGCSVGEVG